MFERKEKGGNSYYPTFFYTYLDVPNDIQYLGRYPVDERTEAFFLHEYIHNLQDLTTPSGYARIETIVDQMKWAVSEMGKRKNIRIPLKPDSTWAYNMKPNAVSLRIAKGEMKKKTELGTDVVYNSPKELKLKDELVPTTNGRYIRRKATTTFVFEDDKHNEYEYRIGEMAISESMAYIMEKHIYPDALEDGADFPYNVVRNVVRWKCPRAEDDVILTAICDVCLMYSFPGIAFFLLINFLENYDGDITPEFIYVYGLGSEICEKLGVETWMEQFDKTNDLAIKQLRDYFNHPYWKDTQFVLTASMVNAYAYRKNKPSFMLDIIKDGQISHNYAFQDALSNMGCMAILTANDQLFYFSPRTAMNVVVDPDWFVVLYQVYKILFTEEAIDEQGGNRVVCWRCCLKAWCQWSFNKKNLPDITSSSYNCIQAPWLNTTDELMAQCAFGRLWGAYNLKRVKLKPDYKKD